MKKIGKAEIIFLILILGAVILFVSLEKRHFTNIQPPKIPKATPDTIWHQHLRSDLNRALMKKNKFGFNGALMVGWDNEIIYEGYVGYEDFANNDSITASTKFQIGSVSKQFTAVAILQLYANGQLHLDDSIGKYFPDLPYQGFTIHHLLVHRSGLSNYIYFIDKIVEDKGKTYTNADIIRLWKAHEPLPYYPPDRRFDYSNSGYMLLASIIEKVSGMSYPEYMRKNIFEPLGMDDTFVYIAGQNDTLPHLAEGYKYHWKVVTEAYLNGTYGDKGIYATARDLFKWDQGLYSETVLPSDTLQKAFKPMGKPKHFKHNYGYGWRIFEHKGKKTYYHAGWWQGFKTLLIRVPEYKLTIIVMKNIKTGAMFSRHELLRIIIDRYLAAPLEALIPDLPQFQQCYIPIELS